MTHACEQLLAGWICFTLDDRHITTTTPRSQTQDRGGNHPRPRAAACGVDPYPGPGDKDDTLLSLAPVLEEARNCRSSQTQELLHHGVDHKWNAADDDNTLCRFPTSSKAHDDDG
jgi:hypothetical protein